MRRKGKKLIVCWFEECQGKTMKEKMLLLCKEQHEELIKTLIKYEENLQARIARKFSPKKHFPLFELQGELMLKLSAINSHLSIFT
jgi:hypothetical protein